MSLTPAGLCLVARKPFENPDNAICKKTRKQLRHEMLSGPPPASREMEFVGAILGGKLRHNVVAHIRPEVRRPKFMYTTASFRS